MWRGTNSCDGARNSSLDKEGYVRVKSHWSGYCECAVGRVKLGKCLKLPSTLSYLNCEEACKGENNISIAYKTSFRLIQIHITYNVLIQNVSDGYKPALAISMAKKLRIVERDAVISLREVGQVIVNANLGM